MNKSGIILLTSTGLSSKNVYDKFESIRKEKMLKKAVIITTASSEKENNQYSQLAYSQLKSTGIETVDFYDFETQNLEDFSSYDVIYVCGGNTFKLMKFARRADFKKDINSLLERGGVYIGVSAGSLILGKSIQIADTINPDKNDVNLNDFNAFNIVDVTIFPHYSLEWENELARFEDVYKIKVERLNNSQAILIENGKQTLI